MKSNNQKAGYQKVVSFMRATTVATIVLCLLMATPEAWAGGAEGLAAYERGDYETALREFIPLAERGNATAQATLGLLYRKGLGVPQNYAEALKWYRRAITQGNSSALFNLGAMYTLGQGVRQDNVQAHKWFNLSATQGSRNGAEGRDLVAKNMTPGQISEAQKLAREWWTAFKKRTQK